MSQKLVKENPLETNSKFFIRTFPCVHMDWDCIKIERNKTKIYVRNLQDLEKNKDNPNVRPMFWHFTADYIFQKSSQQQFYDKVMYNIVNHGYLGIDSIILSFGQSYSGKTYTTIGFEQPQLKGIVPRLIKETLEKRKQCNPNDVVLFISVVEVRGEVVWDLLSTPVRAGSKIRQVSRIEMKSEEQSLKVLTKALTQRGEVLHAPYTGANRGALVITCRIYVTNVIDCKPVIVKSKIHCVDLPGVETIGRNVLTSFKDSVSQGEANLYKMFLEQIVLNIKKSISGELTDYRSQCLMEYLGKSLSTKSNLRFIGHIRATLEDLPVTISVLRLGAIVRSLKSGIGKPDLKPKPNSKLEELQYKVTSLETEVLQRKLIYDEDPIENLTQAHLELLRDSIIEYTKGNTTEFHLLSITEAPTAFIIFKDLFLEREAAQEINEKEAVLMALGDLKRSEMYSARLSVASKADMLTELAQLSSKAAEDIKELTVSQQNDAISIVSLSAVSLGKMKKTKSGSRKSPKLSRPHQAREIDVRALQEIVVRIEYLLACIFNKSSLMSEHFTKNVDEAIAKLEEDPRLISVMDEPFSLK